MKPVLVDVGRRDMSGAEMKRRAYTARVGAHTRAVQKYSVCKYVSMFACILPVYAHVCK